MTRRQVVLAERLAARVAGVMAISEPAAKGPSVADIGGDLRDGWRAAWHWRVNRGRSSKADPPDTVNGWAGWLAAHIVGWAR